METTETYDVPASVSQRLLWMIKHYRSDYGALNCPVVCRIAGPLDPAALQRALDDLAERHDSLRTTFHGRGARLAQRIHPPRPEPIAFTDLSTQDDPGAAAGKALTQELTSPIDPQEWPVRARLWRLSPAEHLFCLNLHHLVTDAWSTGILLRDVCLLYDVHTGGFPTLPAPGWTPAEFVEWQRSLLAGDRLKRHQDYWRRQLSGARLPHLTNTGIPASQPTSPPSAALSVSSSSSQPASLPSAAGHPVITQPAIPAQRASDVQAASGAQPAFDASATLATPSQRPSKADTFSAVNPPSDAQPGFGNAPGTEATGAGAPEPESAPRIKAEAAPSGARVQGSDVAAARAEAGPPAEGVTGQGVAGARVDTVDLPGRVVTGLRDLAKREQTTPFTVLLALFQAQLYRVTGQGDLSVASMFANRTRPELRETVGLLAGMVLLRANVEQQRSFTDLVRHCHSAVLGAFTYSELPFQLLPTNLVDTGGGRADNVMFNVMTETQHLRTGGGVHFELVVPTDIGSRFPFELALVPVGDSAMKAALFRAPDQLDAAGGQSFLRGFAELAAAVVDAPDASLAGLLTTRAGA